MYNAYLYAYCNIYFLGDDFLDAGDTARAVLLFVLLVFSAFSSASETALTAVNKLRIRSLADDDVKGADHAVLIAVGSVTLHLFDVVADFAVTDRRGLTPRVIVRSVDHSTP